MTAAAVARTAVERRVQESMFGKPVIGNTTRGLFVEAMLAVALEPEGWNWVAGDWASWDFEHGETWVTVEVKQSAARQPWSDQYTHEARPRFDIAKRTGYWYHPEDDPTMYWHEERCRPADIYIFAWHGGAGVTADQREPGEWEFYLCNADALPADSKTIGLPALRQELSPYGIGEVARTLSGIAARIEVPRQRAP